ncbi:uncharacterized protein MKZ38_002203 [Zalerion maritima]|uniref:2EXR domain-containing protein n=1 Tax=Zalerion maritima TaxID=339359 RepID=A0AAD5WRF6_9PEZI|nr:uncharacterized protein MKZ38_002203 [Zalerion maritima]
MISSYFTTSNPAPSHPPTTATESTFPRFTSLPPELRAKIYWLATPPRVVHVQEAAEDEEQFYRWHGDSVLSRTVDPSLAHFSHNWARILGPRIKDACRRQPTLEEYGFTSNKGAERPSENTRAMREIPSRWMVSARSSLVYEIVRKGYFFSEAAIPSLLHVCVESRELLVRGGYCLAFRTRTTGPRTWFHFERDVLYLETYDEYGDKEEEGERTVEDVALLSGESRWDVGQFHPDDMRRVRKLALQDGWNAVPNREWTDSSCECTWGVAAVLTLFERVKELFLVEWDTFPGDELWDGWWAVASSPEGEEPEEKTGKCARRWNGRWRCVEVEEIDALLPLFNGCHRDDSFRLESAEGFSVPIGLRNHKKRQTYGDEGYYHSRLGFVKTKIEACWDNILNNDGSEAVVPVKSWHVPDITLVHVLPDRELKFLEIERRTLWEHLDEMKRGKRVGPDIWQGPDVLLNSNDAQGYSGSESPYLSQADIISHKWWWAMEGAIPEPRRDAII